jgi:hypothetical protein
MEQENIKDWIRAKAMPGKKQIKDWIKDPNLCVEKDK